MTAGGLLWITWIRMADETLSFFSKCAACVLRKQHWHPTIFNGGFILLFRGNKRCLILPVSADYLQELCTHFFSVRRYFCFNLETRNLSARYLLLQCMKHLLKYNRKQVVCTIRKLCFITDLNKSALPCRKTQSIMPHGLCFKEKYFFLL